MVRQLGIRITKLETRALFNVCDMDLDGYINFYEFVKGVLNEHEINQSSNARRRVQVCCALPCLEGYLIEIHSAVESQADHYR